MPVTTVIQFGVLMFYAAETRNQTTQPDYDCSQLTNTLSSKIPAKLTGIVQPPGFFWGLIFFPNCYNSLADNTLVGWE